MKIAVIFPKDSEAMFNNNSKRTFGGATVQLYMFAKELAKNKDFAVHSLIPKYKDICFLDNDSFNLVGSYNENDFFLKKTFSLYRTIKKISPDVIIQCGLTIHSCILALYCKLFKIKFIFMFASDIESLGFYQRSGKRCYLFSMLVKNAYLLLPQNEYEYNNIVQSYKNVKHKIHILNKGIDANYTKLGSEKVFDCVWIGRCEELKKPEIFLKLADYNKNLKFLMICAEVDSKKTCFNKIKSEASGIDNLRFLGFVEYEKIFEYLAQSKVFCLTSEMEGDWPLTVLESAISGLPVLSLSLNYNGLFDKFDGGFYCDGNFELMSKYLKILIEDKEIYEKKSLGAREFINNNHCIEKNTKLLLEYINQ